MPAEKRKQSLYFPAEMLDEIMREAIRLDRSLSWMVQQAWRVARTEVMKFPSVNDALAAEPPKPVRLVPETKPKPAPSSSPGEESSEVQEFIRGKFDSGS